MITENTVSSDEVTIEAPVELVWKILTDFDNYGKWNGFCPSAKVETLTLGTAVDMMVDLGHGPSRQVEYLCRIEPNQCIAWQMENKPGDPVHAVRSQYLKRLDDARCSYISIDEFSGPGTASMMEAFAANVEAGFNRCAYDLKAYAEQQFRACAQQQ
ncbi:MAG: SRPBCC domain-containing protein [Gammaproteobacteria bacterium]|nr:SRPBCC domain-containing protein [Gammaproteobacteria bacterium]